MDKKENIETAQIKEKKDSLDWNKWDAVIFIAIVAFIVIVPLRGIEYLDGRFYTYSIFFYACFIDLTVGIFIIVSVIVSIVQLLCNWKRYTRRKRLIKILQIGIPFVFIASFAISLFTPIETHLWQPGYKPFTYGFRERIRSEADIEDIRNWLRTLSKEDCTGKTIDLFSDSDSFKSYWPDSIKWPKSLKVFNPRYVNLDLDENANPKVRLEWGSALGHWGVEIGMEDMEIPPSDFSRYGEYRLPLQPGAYVWHELQ